VFVLKPACCFIRQRKGRFANRPYIIRVRDAHNYLNFFDLNWQDRLGDAHNYLNFFDLKMLDHCNVTDLALRRQCRHGLSRLFFSHHYYLSWEWLISKCWGNDHTDTLYVITT
jgi:hypothetical protein